MPLEARLIARAEWRPKDGEPPPLKRASPSGRALVELGRKLGPHPRGTGIYQAIGREKLDLTGAFAERVLTKGFSGLKATAPVLEYSAYGPCVSLAIALECRGPFWTLEADALAGGLALQQALTDLSLGRCERALVVSCGLDAHATLLVLEPGSGFTAAFRFTAERHDAAPDDPHGLRAVGDAIERKGSVSLRTPEGRGLTVEMK